MANILQEIFTDKRVLLLLLLTLGSILFVYANGGPFGGGLKFGIDFSGGLRIPVMLEQPVDSATMQEMVDNIKTRAATFGLSEVRVTPVGDTEIYVEVPKTNPQLVSDIEKILSKQGVYQGIIDGQVAVSGDSIYPDTVRRESTSYYPGSDWVVGFTITTPGQKQFSQVVKGKGNYPLYMYLDRPQDSIIIISQKDLLENANSNQTGLNLSVDEALTLAISAIHLEGSPVPIYLQDEIQSQIGEGSIIPATNQTKAIISKDAPQSIKDELAQLGFIISEKEAQAMQPEYIPTSATLSYTITRWDAVGLKSAPILSPSLAEGTPSRSYVITGSSSGTGQALINNADYDSREIMSVLKGGAMPVQISLGSVQEVEAKFGEEILNLSMMGLLLAILLISIYVAIIYRSPQVVLPIVLISISEMIILITVIGFFTIDLAAMAGIIATVGISVDAQIIITDELLKRKEGEELKDDLDKAFNILVTNATVAVVAMAPLLLISGLVEIIGFATTTVIGYILGVAISRPAYGAIAVHLFEKKHSN